MSYFRSERTTRQPSLDFEGFKSQYQGRWQQLLQSVHLPEAYLTGRHTACPLCGGKDRFRFDDKDGRGTWYCNNCGPGDGLKLLHLFTGYPYRELIRDYSKLYFEPPKLVPDLFGPMIADDQEQARRKNLEARLRETRAVQSDDPVDLYLRRRGVSLGAYSSEVRFHPALRYYNDTKSFTVHPAMVARILDPEGRLVSLHQTFLTSEGSKASVEKPKKFAKAVRPGATSGGAVRLYPANEILAVTEGLETALLVHQSLSVPVWSATSAGALQRLVIPSCVKQLLVCADNDFNETGQRAAVALARRASQMGIRCKVLIPDTIGQDWADVLAHC